MNPGCRIVRALAPSNENGALPELLERHVSTCLTCQAEMVRYGRLRRQLAALLEVTIAAPESLTAVVAGAITPWERPASPAASHSNVGRIAAATGAVAAAAVGAVAVAVWRSSRPAMR